MSLWVKICGVTRPEDARAAFDAGADAIGINFWSGSRRCCSIAKARTVMAALSPSEMAFGVFVDAAKDEIERVMHEVGIRGLQFHGREDDDEVARWHLPKIRACAALDRSAVVVGIRSRDRFLHERNAGYRLLVDHGSGGGSGVAVDESLLDGIDLSESILAGGLTPQNVAARVARFRPFGVDVAGGVENAPGIKDADAIAAFIRAARSEPVQPPRSGGPENLS